MWATSIGLTFSHSPVPGERKSGIPDGTEMPAPVNATTEPAAPISSASRARPPSVDAVPKALACAASTPLAPREVRGAFAEEGGDPLLGVPGGEGGREALLLGLDARVEVAVAGDALDLRDRERRLPGELARPLKRRVEQFVVFDDPVDEAQLEGFLGEDRIADEVHLKRLVGADETGQPLRAAEAGDDPELDLGLAEERRAGGDPHVARHRELAAAAEGETVDGRDRGDPRALHLAEQPVGVREQLRARRFVHRRERL